MSDRQWHEAAVKELHAEQAGLSSAEVEDLLRNKKNEAGDPIYEAVFNPDTAPRQEHRWIDRGLKLSCEGANHPFHQAFKRF